MKILITLFLPLFIYAQTVTLQILGSGGPEFSKRASSSYLIWVDGKAKVMVDAGAGAFTRFTEAGAKIENLEFLALTHLHITPKRIGEVAQKAGVKHLVLSHRMKRTYDSEAESLKLIKENYKGEIIWAEDLMKIEIN